MLTRKKSVGIAHVFYTRKRREGRILPEPFRHTSKQKRPKKEAETAKNATNAVLTAPINMGDNRL